MAETTKIEWCDATFNPWIGCTKVSPGCDHCYAEATMDTRYGKVHWGAGQPRVRTGEKNWNLPKRWNAQPWHECTTCGLRGLGKAEAFTRLCTGCGNATLVDVRRRVFCSSLADVFDNAVDPQWRVDLFKLIRSTPNLDWLLLTKRIGNADRMMREAMPPLPDPPGGWPWPQESWQPPSNVWLGATVVNQEEADRDIPKLLAVPARVRFLSMEPLLGPVDLTDITLRRGTGDEEHFDALRFDGDEDDEPDLGTATLDWVIVGGESGKEARPMHPDWVRGLRDQCEAAGVPLHFKQWGEWAPAGREPNEVQRVILQHARPTARCYSWPDGETLVHAGKKAAGRLLDGVEHNGFPTT